MKDLEIEAVMAGILGHLKDAQKRNAAVSFSIEQGVTYSAQGGYQQGAPNGTMTLTVEINGGAKDVPIEPAVSTEGVVVP